jgi:small subunit ribosomal protein S25
MVRTLPQSRLSRVLEHLKREPLLALPNVTALKLKLALRNDHFGARYISKARVFLF